MPRRSETNGVHDRQLLLGEEDGLVHLRQLRLLAEHGDVRGRQQEHLVGHALDLAVEALREAAGEVDETRASASLICERLMMTGMPSRKLSAMTWASRYCWGAP